jgi:3-phenylpropionate/cinnamic acid dioxygenase small subunit
VSGPHRWLVAANWKTAAENFGGDGYHIASTHGSARELGIDTTTSQARKWNRGCQIYCGNGHVLVAWLCPPDDAGPWYAQPSVELVDYMKEHAAEIESRLGAARACKIAPSAGTVFPNLSVHWLSRTIRVWQPRGPDQMEVWSWAIVDRAAPPKIKETMRFVSQYRFSPTGVFEQDDMDNWIQVTGAARSVIGRRFPANYQMGVSEEITETDLRGRLSSRWSDSNQLSLYMHWQSCSRGRAGARSRVPSMDSDLRHKIEDFFYLEAELLDERRLREWLDLFTDDVHYWMPIRHNPLDRPKDLDEELSKPGETYYFNDNKETLRIRVERVYSKTAWAEMPPSRTRHLISNIRIKKDDGVEIEVRSNFMVYRTRMEKDEDLFVGTRTDILRRVDAELKIARRTILLDQAVLAAKNISVFL